MKYNVGQSVQWENKLGVIYEIVSEKKKLYKVLFSMNNHFSATPMIFVIEEDKLKPKDKE